MGAIPVLETYYRKDGLYRTYDDLPVLWVDHYDNVTPTLLENAYPTILAKAQEYNFAKLTNEWWFDLINSYRWKKGRGSNNIETQIDIDSAGKIHKGDEDMLKLPQNKREYESVEFPETITLCNVTMLSLDKDKMLAGQQSMAFVPANGTTHYAYGPWITKSGSTSLIESLKYASNNAPNIEATANEEIFDQYEFLSVLRHPMDRALAGYHQIEVFWLMNWIDGPITTFGLRWWNTTCLNSTYASDTKANGKYQCMGTKAQTTTTQRLRRLNDFLGEVEEKGYWDQHITPMSYLISSNKFHSRARYFDIGHVDRLTEIVALSAGKEGRRHSSMKRGDSDQGMDWVTRWSELVTLSRNEELARVSIEKLCNLYQSDVKCLHYDVPECDP